MTYGLYDLDLRYYPVPFYNLELMKLSAYYKKKREIVSLSPSFSPNRYRHFIVRQDFYYPVNIPFNFKNIEYGGRVFDGEKYKPLPDEVESMRPDKSLYNKVKLSEFRSSSMASSFGVMKRSEHARLSLDGKTIWKDFEKQLLHESKTSGIIFHDYNLNEIEGSYEFIKDNLGLWIPSQSRHRIGMKYPITIDKEEDLLKWLTINSTNQYFALDYCKIIENHLLYPLSEIKQYSNAWKYTNLNLKNYSETELLSEINHLFRSIVNLRTKRIAFPLIYDENVFTNNEWKRVMKLIKYYSYHLVDSMSRKNYDLVEPFETMYSYIKNYLISDSAKQNSFLTRENVKEIFQFVRENNYDLFKDFYEYRGEEVR